MLGLHYFGSFLIHFHTLRGITFMSNCSLPVKLKHESSKWPRNPFDIILFNEHQKWAGAHHPQREFHFGSNYRPKIPPDVRYLSSLEKFLSFFSHYFFETRLSQKGRKSEFLSTGTNLHTFCWDHLPILSRHSHHSDSKNQWSLRASYRRTSKCDIFQNGRLLFQNYPFTLFI